MDTTSLGINQGCEELFIGWIIVIIGLIVIFFLSKMNKKEKKSTDVDLSPTQKPLNGNDNKTLIFTTNSNGKSSSDNQPKTIATKTGINENPSDEQIIPQPIKPIDTIVPPIIIIKPEPKPSKPKHIGYNPTNIFAQTEPLNYPYVIMPSRPECVIKFPQKGRSGRKGYKEESFLQFIQKYFRDTFKIYDDRYVLAKTNRYEPDFSLLNEKEGINIFLDIEIDEPYEGINDVNNRKATHFQYADTNRNNEFKNRGWIVIRFAEIQIHQNPEGCCLFIAEVIKSIYPQFNIPQDLATAKRLEPIQQWTKELALTWSKEKYREQYLGIDRFGYLPETSGADIALIQDEETEKEVIDDAPIIPEKEVPTIEQSTIEKAIQLNKYVAFQYEGEKTIVKPSKCDNSIMEGFCYVKNAIRKFEISKMKNIHQKDNYCTVSLSADKLGIKNVANIMNIIIPNHKYVRMEYTKPARSFVTMDPETKQFIPVQTEAETSIRTISDIQLDTEGWGENYIRAYCHKREDGRTFYFARISLLEVLDL